MGLQRNVIAAVAGALLFIAPLAAQEHGTSRPGPWIPLGSRLDQLVAWTIAEGGLGRIDPLTRPYRLAAVQRAVDGQDTADLSTSGRRVFGWLRREMAAAGDSTDVVAEVGQAFYRNGRRDSFRGGGASGSGPMAGVWASLVRGPVVVVLNPAVENRLLDDPEFTGKTDNAVAGRLQAGYVAITGERGDLRLGRAAQQWGPALFEGLQLSPSAYATDQLNGELRIGRFALTTIAQRLDDQYSDTIFASVPVNRWFLAHRLSIRAGRGWWLTFTETGVYGGPGRGFEPAFHMPLYPALLAEWNEERSVNLLWGAALHAPLTRAVSLEAEGVIDDAQLDHKVLTDHRPWSGGYTIVVQAALPSLPVHAAAGYTRVRSLTYRNSFEPYAVYAVQGVGIGRNFSDYDQWLLRLAARPGPTTGASLELTYLRQGAGDFRLPFPNDTVLAGPGQGFLVAPWQHGVAGRFTAWAEPLDGLTVNGEIGVRGMLGGGSEPIAALSVRLRFDAVARRLGGAWPALERGADRAWP